MLSGLLGGFAVSAPGLAADTAFVPNYTLPAVDGTNIKADAYAGKIVRQHIHGARASITTPFGERFGGQVDVQGGRLGGDPFLSLAGHFFWRDPKVGLIGLYASHTAWMTFATAQVTQISGEGELYWNRWTLQGIAGVEFGNTISRTFASATSTTTITPIPFGSVITVTDNLSALTEGYSVKTRFFDQINLKYYLTDNLQAFIGHRYLGGKHALALGTEWALPMQSRNLGSFFIEARLGEHTFQGAWAGLRIYSGKSDKSLIRRHREDDPIVWDTLFSILNNSTSNFSSSSSSSSTQVCDFGPSEFGPPGSCEDPGS
jgi:hypothetical protein